MATFGQGSAELIEVKTIEKIGAGGGLTIYTVPTGRYAVVSKFFIGFDNSIEAIYNYAATTSNTTLSLANTDSGGVLLNEGDQLRAVNNGVGHYLFIREYKKP